MLSSLFLSIIACMLSCNALLRRLVTRVFCRDLLQAVTRSDRKLWTQILSPIVWMHSEYNRAMTRLIGPHLTSCEWLCSAENVICLCDCDTTYHHNLLKLYIALMALLQWIRPDNQLRPRNTMLFSNSSDGQQPTGDDVWSTGETTDTH